MYYIDYNYNYNNYYYLYLYILGQYLCIKQRNQLGLQSRTHLVGAFGKRTTIIALRLPLSFLLLHQCCVNFFCQITLKGETR